MHILLGRQAFETLISGVLPEHAGVFYSRIEDSFVAYCYNFNKEFEIGLFSTEEEGFNFIKENYFNEKSVLI